MGLRQLYFLIGGLLRRLVYLSVGLSIILGFIGIKLILHALHSYHLGGLGAMGWRDSDLGLVDGDHRDPHDHHRGQPGQVEVRPGPAGHG